MMTKEEARVRIAALSEELERHNYNYYILAKPTISDYEFDMMLEELARLEHEFPEFLSPSSPTQRVGGGITKEFKSVKHKYPMLSLANSYSREEIADFISRVKKTIDEEVEFCCELFLRQPFGETETLYFFRENHVIKHISLLYSFALNS